MYRDAAGVWSGLAKNAGEGLGSPTAIVPWTLLLGLGHVAPALLLAIAAAGRLDAPATGLAAAATVLAYLPRLIAVRRFRQPLSVALGHPLGIVLLLAIQWHALVRRLLGRPAAWKGRLRAGSGSAGHPGDRRAGAARARLAPGRVNSRP